MKSKLTLSLDTSVVERSKKIASQDHSSLSSLVERLLIKEIEKDTSRKKKLVAELHGIAGSVEVDTNWKNLIRDAAYEKHGK